MKTKTKRHLFCLISYFFALFVLPISIAVGAFDDMKTSKKADADTDYILVGNIAENTPEWDNNNNYWTLQKTNNVYVIKNVYMQARSSYSDFRIVQKGTWEPIYGWNKLSAGTNEPGFSQSTGDANNIHITKTGYYDIKLYDSESKIDITYSELTLVGNIESRNDWNVNPQSGKWKFQKNGSYGFKLENVYMVTHSDSNFRILPWGDTTWQTKLGWQQLNYSGVSRNEPSFTSAGTDNNIHITETGYYNIFLKYSTDKKDWYIELYYDQDSTTVLECQIHVNNKKIVDPSDSRGFDFDFVYDDSTASKYSSLGSEKRLVVHNHKKFYLKKPTIPTGYTLDHYNIGYTNNTSQYTGSQYGSSYYKTAWKEPDDNIRNYLNLYYQTINYSISYTLNGGTVTTSNPSSYTVEKSTFTLNNPTKTGYTFAGWSGTGITGTSTSVTISKGSTGNRSYTANWTANTYSITYKDKGNTSYSGDNAGSLPNSRTYGTTLNLVDGSKTGYIFDGWYEDSDCTGSKVTSIAGTIIGDKTLYAKFVKRPSFASGFVIIGNSTFNQSSGIGGTSSSPTWEYFASTQEMDDPTAGTQQAAIQRVQLSSGSEFKHAYYDGSTVSPAWDNTGLVSEDSSWSGTYLTAGDSTNAQVKEAGNNLYYDAFVGGDNKLYVTPSHLDVHMKGVFIRGETTVIEPTDLTPASPIYGVALYKQTYTAPTSSWSYTYSGVTYTFGGWYTDSALTTPYVSTDNVTSDITIYARFDDLNNYLTYDHNDGSGTRQLVDPSHIDVSQQVLSYSDLGWNDSYFRSFSNWNTESDGTGDRYDLGDTITVTETTTLYAQQNWHQVYISIDDGRTWNSTIKSAETPSGTQIQYETEQKLVVDSDYARIKIKYRNVNTGVETILDNGDIDFEGYNYNAETGGVNVSFTDNIFLKVTNSNTLQCYIPGATQRTLIIKHAAGGETAVAMYLDTDDQWKSNDHEVYVRKGDKIWVKYETGSAYKSYCMAETYDGFERDTTDGNIAKCTITGAYTIYLQKGSTGEWKDIVVGTRDETKSAEYFARLFNHAMCEICDNYDTNTAASFIDAWQENETENAVAVFNELSSTCQTGLKGNAYDSDYEVAEFKAKYDYILGKYGYGTGENELHDFLGRTPSLRSNSFITLPTLFDNRGNDYVSLIIIASSISLLSITALSILLVKKRKRKED